MAFDIEEFKRYLVIDKRALDDDVIQQPSLFERVSDALAEANAERDAMKEQLTTVDAELDIKVREEAERKSIKATESNIKSRIQTDRSHQLAFKQWLKTKERSDKLFALKESFQQRSESLKNLCKLYVANYFEDSSLRGNSATDEVAYHERRKRLGEARRERANVK